jgi:hypothetical protein
MPGAVALLCGWLSALPAWSQTVTVPVRLPVRAGIDLEGKKTVAVAPFIVVRREGEGGMRGRDIDVQGEFERYLEKIIRRETDLKIVETGYLNFPTFDMEQLARDQDFWSAVGDQAQADLILAGSLDFDIQDRSGYRTEEYVSPFDARTYYRQVLVEQTGFEYDIVIQVYDAATGELLFSDNFKDFKTFEGESADPLAGMFQNLLGVEDRIAGIFSQQVVQANRVLYTR